MRLAHLGLALFAGAATTLGVFPAAAREDRKPATSYAERCAFCHDASGWGTRTLARRLPPGEAELLKRKVLPAQYVEYVVRHGIGSMPQFTPTELSDAELRALAAWLADRNRK